MLFLHVVSLLLFFHFQEGDAGIQIIFLSCIVLTVRITSDQCLSSAAEQEIAVIEISGINSSLSTCFLLLVTLYFENFSQICFSVA